MFNRLRSALHSLSCMANPFHRIPFMIAPNWNNINGSTNIILPNPHVGIGHITSLLARTEGMEAALRQLDGEYLMIVVVDELVLGRAVLRANIYKLGYSAPGDHHFIAASDGQRVCARGWKEEGYYYFFVNVEHHGLKCRSSFQAITDDRKHNAAYLPDDPLQSWKIELDGNDSALLGLSLN